MHYFKLVSNYLGREVTAHPIINEATKKAEEAFAYEGKCNDFTKFIHEESFIYAYVDQYFKTIIEIINTQPESKAMKQLNEGILSEEEIKYLISKYKHENN